MNVRINSSEITNARLKVVTGQVLEGDFRNVLASLVADEPLAEWYRDHALTGDWKDHRDCHIKPDLVLIYRKPDEDRLQLIRLGSHSELGL